MVLAEDLRKAVLQYAVEGKLTKRLSTDSDVDELIVKIKEEKTELEKRKKARKEVPYPEISDDEKEFEIPENWRWIRLGEIGVYKKGPFGSALTKSIFVPKSEDSIKVYEQKNAIQKDASLGEYYITREYYDEKMSGFTLESGDIIVSCAGTIGETYIMPENIELGIINQALMRMNIAQSINIDYFLLYFDHILKKNAKKSSNGSAIKNIPPFEVFKKMLLPLPPVEEQQRIVDRIKVITKEIDEYSVVEGKLLSLKKTFPNNMRNAILQYAMQGKLTEQLENDGNAEQLYEDIISEKKEKIELGKISEGKKLPSIEDDEIPFEIPENWKWVRWGDISENIQYGYNAPALNKGRIKMVRISDIQDNQVLWETVPYCDISEKDIITYKLSNNDILFARTGGTVGKSFLVKEVPEEAVFAGYLIRTQYSDKLVPEYLKYFMGSQLYWTQLHNGTSATAQPNCNGKTLSKMILPLPPVEEQRRIVEKLNQILPLCDDLKV